VPAGKTRTGEKCDGARENQRFGRSEDADDRVHVKRESTTRASPSACRTEVGYLERRGGGPEPQLSVLGPRASMGNTQPLTWPNGPGALRRWPEAVSSNPSGSVGRSPCSLRETRRTFRVALGRPSGSFNGSGCDLGRGIPAQHFGLWRQADKSISSRF
jgi:hypothetical protein